MNKGLVGGALAGAALFGAACAVVAPRSRSDERERTWEYLRRFRYAHRGLYDPELGIPENSLAAFERAARMGFGSELDVHFTADYRLVVIHDSYIERMTGAKGIIEELTFDEVLELRLSGTEEGIPLFSDVLDAYESLAPGIPLIVEVKTAGGNHARLTEAVMAELDRHSVPYCVESFDPHAVKWLHDHRDDVFRGQLSQNFLARSQRSGMGLAVDAVATALAANALTRPDFIAYRFHDSWMPSNVLATRVLGGAYVGWTLRSEEELLICEDRGGIGIFERFIPDAEVRRKEHR